MLKLFWVRPLEVLLNDACGHRQHSWASHFDIACDMFKTLGVIGFIGLTFKCLLESMIFQNAASGLRGVSVRRC